MLAVRSFVLLLLLTSSAFAGSKIVEAKIPGSKNTIKFTYKQTEQFIYITPEFDNAVCTKPIAKQPVEEIQRLPEKDPVVNLKKKMIEGKGSCLLSIRVKQGDGLMDAISYYTDLDVTTTADNMILGMLHACVQDLKLGNL